MKSDFKTKKLKPFVARCSILAVMGLCFLFSVSMSPDNSQVTRAEFIEMVSQNQPDHPLLPKNHAELSQEDLYDQTARILKIRGFKVLSDKGGKEPLTDQEFVRVTYALSGERPGKNLFEQKQFLKQEGIVKSADIGITTGVEGKILRTHQGEKTSNDIKLASPVFMNDRIKTKPESKATFTFDDKSSLTLGENASVNIKKHIYDPEKDLRKTVVKVALGTVRFVVTKGKAKGSAFEVLTPTAVAGVRGTEFVVSVDKSGKTSFINIEGSIDTAPLLPNGQRGSKKILTKGKMLVVTKDGVVSDIQNLPPLLVNLAANDALPPGLLAMAKNGTFPPGLLKKAEAGELPPGLMKQADKQKGPPANRGKPDKTMTKAKVGGAVKKGGVIGKAKERMAKAGGTKGGGPSLNGGKGVKSLKRSGGGSKRSGGGNIRAKVDKMTKGLGGVGKQSRPKVNVSNLVRGGSSVIKASQSKGASQGGGQGGGQGKGKGKGKGK
ncbi:MAG: FecR domain-containing protein [Nitrospinae bacterium]|nr:FecR domain-containing protein [Nitrospinota bacterium]